MPPVDPCHLHGACAPSPSVVILAESPPGWRGAWAREPWHPGLWAAGAPACCALSPSPTGASRHSCTSGTPLLCSRLLAAGPPPRLHLLQICPALRLQHSHCLRHLSGAVCSADPSEERAKSPRQGAPQPTFSSTPPALPMPSSYQIRQGRYK